MSASARCPIPIPAGVEVKIDGNRRACQGPKGELTRTIHEDDAGQRWKTGRSSSPGLGRARSIRSLHGLTRTPGRQHGRGRDQGLRTGLEIRGVGYRASKQGNKLVLAVGYSHPVEMEPPPGIEIEVPQPTQIIVRGIDKELVGEVAAHIRPCAAPEPYLGKGIRYEGERICARPARPAKCPTNVGAG